MSDTKKKISPEQLAKMQAARKAKAEAAKAAGGNNAAPAVAVFKPVSGTSPVIAKLRIPRKTPISAVQAIVDGIVNQIKATGKVPATVEGTLRVR